MPRYVVHVLRREIVVLGTDIEVSADSKKAAREKVKALHQRDEIDDCLWWEEDSWYTDDPLEIESVQAVEKAP
jgi:hypothetical protein